MLVGYARVSSAGQSLDIQREQLEAAGCAPDNIYEEKRSGRTAAGRPALQEALRFVRKGDTLVVTRLDRLARSVLDLRQMLDALSEKGVGFRALQQGEFDTSTSTGKALIGLLGVIAEFENDLRRDRQAEGIARAKAQGKHLGRPSTVPAEAIREKLAEGLSVGAIHKELGVPRTSIYRVRDAMKAGP